LQKGQRERERERGEREREERGSVNVIDRGDNHTAVGVTVVETTALFISKEERTR
jgi:hypothetical protein